MSPSEEMIIFLGYALCGALCGVIFDFFLCLRISLRLKSAALFMSDTFLWAILTAFCGYFVFGMNHGLLRFFLISGFLSGIVLYFLLISSLIKSIFLKIIEIICKIIKLFFKILLTPLQFSYKIILAPLLRRRKKINSGV